MRSAQDFFEKNTNLSPPHFQGQCECVSRHLKQEKKVKIGKLKVLSQLYICLLYTSDAADEEDSVDLGGRRIIKKKNLCASRAFINILTRFY